MLSLVTRRPVLFGLLYILVWEGLLGNLLTGTRSLSIEQFVADPGSQDGRHRSAHDACLRCRSRS